KVSRVPFKRITKEQWAQHTEAVVSYADLRASIKGYYEENVDHKEQTDKVIEAAMNSLDKNNIARGDLLNALNGVAITLKAIQDAVKEVPALNKKVIEATKAYTKNSTHLTELLTLIKNFDFQGFKFLVESLQATALRQDKHLAKWAKSSTSLAWSIGLRMTGIENSQATIRMEVSSLRQDTSDIKSMMTEIYQAFKEPPSYTKREHVAMEDDAEKLKSDKAEEETTRAVLISVVRPIIRPNPGIAMIESSSRPPLTDPTLDILIPQREGKGKKIATDDVESPVKLVPASKVVQVDPDERVRVPYMINEKMHYLTNDEITKHLEKEELIKKAAEQARLLAITKPEVEGEKFKKAHDAELKVLNKERSEKLRKSLKLKKHMYENYMWTIGNRLKPEKITDVKIHPHTKPIIPKNKNVVVKDLMKSLSRRYERIKKIPEELGIKSALPAPILE
ncbi:hypothetical protein Tco_0128906, partial [Tanacetum coccineum]